MKEIIEKILSYLPLYLTQLGSCFIAPKTFIATKNMEGESSFQEALIFLGITSALIVLATTPFPPKTDLLEDLVSTVIYSFIVIVLGAAGLRISWRLVGGKAPLKCFLVTYTYFYCTLGVIGTLFLLIVVGIFKSFAQEYFDLAISASLKHGQMPALDDNAMKIAPLILFVLFVGNLMVATWGFIAGGSYRQLNGLSKVQSFFASMIMLLFSALTFTVVFFPQKALLEP